MAVTNTANIKVSVKSTMNNAGDLSSAVAQLDYPYALTLANGTGASQANMMFDDQRTTDATGETLDLAGALTNRFGTTITFTAIKAIMVKADSANTLNVVIGAAAATQFVGPLGSVDDTIAVPPGGIFLITNPSATGWACTGGSLDFLKVAASASGNVTYDIVLIGEV